MFRSLTLTDFQSHKNSHLALGPYTVIVGSSSSGKSAVVRALRTVAENARGTSYVRQGAKSCRVALEVEGAEPVLGSSTIVTIERGKSLSTYEVRLPGNHDDPVLYTKCGQTVPDGVSDVLGLGESKLWLAGQFDRPFLLDETGAEVARVLGRLTNVTTIYAAVREANRRASEAKRTAEAKKRDLDEVVASQKQHEDLPDRLQVVESFAERVERCDQLVERARRLRSLSEDARDAKRRTESAQSRIVEVPDTERLTKLMLLRSRLASVLSDVESANNRLDGAQTGIRDVPDTSVLGPIVVRRASLREALSQVEAANVFRDQCEEKVAASRALAESARAQFTDALVASGTCPTCGADSEHARVDAIL